MEKGSFLAIEMFVFLGLVGWLLYYQFSTSGHGTDGKASGPGEKTPESVEEDQDSSRP